MSDNLLNLTIMDRLAQLEGRVPGITNKQLAMVDEHWSGYLASLDMLLKDNKINEMIGIVHKMRGHIGMIGLSALCDKLGQIETELAAGHAPKNWAKQMSEISALKKRSTEAARRYSNHVNGV